MPAGDGPVVVDTTPVIALALVQRLDLFRSLYGRVVIPSAVRSELLAGGGAQPGGPALASAPDELPLGLQVDW